MPTMTTRSHFDIRELKYLHMADGWDAVIGIDTVFLGRDGKVATWSISSIRMMPWENLGL